MSALVHKVGTGARTAFESHAAEILGLIEAQPDITLLEIVEHLEASHGLKPAQSSVWRLLDRHGMTFKKNRARQRATAP
jgi:transposase